MKSWNDTQIPKVRVVPLLKFTIEGLEGCYHISIIAPGLFCVNDGYKMIVTDTESSNVQNLEDLAAEPYDCYGLHTVNSDNEFIYIDRFKNIRKLSNDLMTTTLLTNIQKPQCVHCSKLTGDFLVGMQTEVNRYNRSWQLIQRIRFDSNGIDMYSDIHYITENNNGDVVVSDIKAVVVTERGGRHRFSYTGPPPGSRLQPCGICTGALSHILVCDYMTNTVQIVNMGGQFLSHLLISPSGIFYPNLTLLYSYDT